MGAPKAAPAASNVRVVARIRPLAKYELANGSKQIVTSLPSFSSSMGGPIQVPTEPEVLEVKPEGAEKRWFELDAVLDGKSTQEEAYIKSGARVAVTENLFKGFNCTILAYGQTGAGKTFTMGSAAGTSMDIGEFDGIIPRACVDLFSQIQSRCDGNAQVELSYLEIYNEEMRDLLVNEKEVKKSKNGRVPEMKVRENLNGEVYVSGLSARSVASPKEIGEFMEEASGRRVVASTKMNAVSSRSHAICVLRIKGVLEDSTKFQAKLTLVDLAGSERIKKTGAEGGRRKEGININKGLFVLGQVVSALSETRPKYKRKPPYRDSILTRLLQDSLGGNSRTIMVACVSPADFNLDETVTTLRYATNARNIKNTATRNVLKSLSPEEAAKLQRENQLLKAQVQELQQTIRKMGADLDGSSTAATSTVSSIDSVSSEEDGEDLDAAGEMTPSKQKARIQELENEVRKLKLSAASGSGSSAITESMAEDAITLPSLKKRIAELEEEVAAKSEVESENMELQQEMNDLKSDASSARLAADKMSKILDQLKSLKGDEIDKKKMEFDHIKVEEAWVSFVYQVLETNRQHMSKLQNDFMVVAKAVDSPDFMIDGPRSGFMSRIKNRIGNRRLGGKSPASGNGSAHGYTGEGSSRHGRSVPVGNGSSRHERSVATGNSSRRERSTNAPDDSSSRHQRSVGGNSSRRSRTISGDEETKQTDPQQDPTNIMKVIVNLKDELKAAHEVIRQQRVQVESAMQHKSMEESKGDDPDSESSNANDADVSTVPVAEFRKLKEQYTKLEIDRCWAEFQLRDRITNDSLKFHRRIRAVMQKSRAQGNSVQEDPEVREMEIKSKVDGEIRQRLRIVMEHLKCFEGRMVQMQTHVSSEMDSLGAIRDSLRVQQDQMELEIGTSEIEQHMLDKDDGDLLAQLTTLLVGPVKNLGSFPSEDIQEPVTGAVI
mmetsp:Transcript_18352/g.42319  ORF Transcript_18352/g.42319 Transcript_18352/m.42319 type:complete len:948 (+) Transcript_18352:331-3174(+)|eukprot:CAMPEP_0197174640 /NCGR_PEP_ID=MMETSP1423-20130617/1065_1 /TAXON_ID=476441 /ORGANISM="Pseudo-nitzschia heimii, Strain UNC1101" /LENGTH=947 /DNA_ID=CAMNT_0042623583 /DNA_START=247 /DNA_END=3090 /DNA_ORIENTATION=+